MASKYEKTSAIVSTEPGREESTDESKTPTESAAVKSEA